MITRRINFILRKLEEKNTNKKRIGTLTIQRIKINSMKLSSSIVLITIKGLCSVQFRTLHNGMILYND